MKKTASLIILLASFHLFCFAQTGGLWIKNSDKGLFLEHSVAPKEGLFSIGRLYNVHPRYIATYNNMDMAKGLSIGQLIRIPLTDTNFNQNTGNGVPVYYKAGEKDGLSRISTINKVSPENLRSWNHLSNNNVVSGTKLIVGFLISKDMKTPPVMIVEKKETPEKRPVEEKKIETPVTVKEQKKNETQPGAAEKKEDKKEDKLAEVKKEEVKPVETKKTEITPEYAAAKSETGGQGFFKWHFEQQTKQQTASKEETVTSGIFKTISGWSDGKYYLLIDGVQPGTIIKISNPVNNKSVFAKVLGQMEGINLNKGLNIRISNSAASTLGITELDKFIVKVNY
jgi:hypothetical protein